MSELPSAHAFAPWPSNVVESVSPLRFKPLSFLNTIQVDVGNELSLDGAFKMPLMVTIGEYLLWQGPSNVTGPIKNVPLGTSKVAFPGCAQASCQAAKNA